MSNIKKLLPGVQIKYWKFDTAGSATSGKRGGGWPKGSKKEAVLVKIVAGSNSGIPNRCDPKPKDFNERCQRACPCIVDAGGQSGW